VLALYDKNGSNANTLLHKRFKPIFRRFISPQTSCYGAMTAIGSSSIALYSFDTGAASTLVQRHGITDNGRSFRVAFLWRAVESTTKATVMTVVLRVEVLAREVARRGWNFADLAQAAGISSATVTAARAGRPVSPKTLRSIATALASAPSLDGVDELLLG
jgi:DNA-binding Xre family transcriptional regulator